MLQLNSIGNDRFIGMNLIASQFYPKVRTTMRLTSSLLVACLAAVAARKASGNDFVAAMEQHRQLKGSPKNFCGTSIGKLVDCYSKHCKDEVCDIEPGGTSIPIVATTKLDRIHPSDNLSMLFSFSTL